jgi:hypothetical protein
MGLTLDDIYLVGDEVRLMGGSRIHMESDVSGISVTDVITLWQDYGDTNDPYITINSSGIGIKGKAGDSVDITVGNMAVVVDDNQIILTDGTTPWDAFGPWIDWGGSLGAQQGAGLTFTIGEASYVPLGKTAIVKVALTFTSTGTAGQPIYIGGFPKTMVTSGSPPCGSAYIFDNGTAYYPGMVTQQGTTTFQFLRTDAPFGGVMGGTDPSIPIVSGDQIGFFAIVELA